jgi:putative ABC transport system ATP-binding protein
MEEIIRAEHLSRVFQTGIGESFPALRDATLSIERGTLSILRGKSGSGKTTLINLLGALDRPTSGKVWLEGAEITGLGERKCDALRREKMGFVFQSVSLIPTMTVYENVEFALRLGAYPDNHAKRVEEVLSLVGLSQRIRHMPAELSGGEQQRVAIARAIAHRPSVVFADEPTAELDSVMAGKVIGLFRHLVEEEHLTILMTTHDMSLLGAGDRTFTMEAGVLQQEV